MEFFVVTKTLSKRKGFLALSLATIFLANACTRVVEKVVEKPSQNPFVAQEDNNEPTVLRAPALPKFESETADKITLPGGNVIPVIVRGNERVIPVELTFDERTF